MASERLIVEIDEKGALVVKRRLDETGESARRAEGGVTLLRRALGLLGTAVTLRALAQYADAFTDIQNQLRGSTRTSTELASVTQRLYEVSQRTRQSFSDTVSVYDRIANVQRDLGITQDRAIKLQEQFNQAVLASGGSLKQSAEPLGRFVTGLADGSLKGIELTRTLNQLPGVAKVIADHLHVNIGELAKLADQGKLTSQVIVQAFDSQEAALAKQAKQTVPSLREAFTVLSNAFIVTVGTIDKSTGATKFLSEAMISLSKNMGQVLSVGKALIPVLTIVFSQQLLALGLKSINATSSAIKELSLGIQTLTTTSMSHLILSVRNLATEFKNLGLVLARNPLLIIGAVAIGAFIAQADALKRKEKQVEDQEEAVYAAILKTIRARRAQVVANKEANDSFNEYIKKLQTENGLLKLTDNAREVRLALMEAEKAKGSQLTAQENARVTSLIKERQAIEAATTAFDKYLESRDKAFAQSDLDKRRGPGELGAFGPKLEGVDKTGVGIDQGSVDQPTIIQSTTKDLSEMQKVGLDALTSLTQGFASLILSADGFGEALRSLFQNVAANIAGAIAQLLIVRGLLSLFPGLGGLGGIFASAAPVHAQHGASFTVGGQGGPDSQLVQVQASPGERFDITPPGKQPASSAPAPDVNVKSVTVIDPQMMLDALRTKAGEQLIINTVQRNPGAFRKVLGG